METMGMTGAAPSSQGIGQPVQLWGAKGRRCCRRGDGKQVDLLPVVARDDEGERFRPVSNTGDRSAVKVHNCPRFRSALMWTCACFARFLSIKQSSAPTQKQHREGVVVLEYHGEPGGRRKEDWKKLLTLLTVVQLFPQ